MRASRKLRVGLTQWHATADVARNVGIAVDLIGRAAADGARLVVLPENGLMLGTNAQMRERALSETAPEIVELRETAAKHAVTVVVGGMKNATAAGVFNSALVINPEGTIAGRYDKIHLFDAKVNGQSFEASSVEQAGTSPVLLDLDGTILGLTICYDLRFPELFRALVLSGAQVLLVPASFTHVTGESHWHTLLRARAIENACFVIASATVRSPTDPGQDAFPTYGHALAVAPWGQVLADLRNDPCAVRVVELDLAEVDRARSALPVLGGTKPPVYAAAPRVVRVRTRIEEAT